MRGQTGFRSWPREIQILIVLTAVFIPIWLFTSGQPLFIWFLNGGLTPFPYKLPALPNPPPASVPNDDNDIVFVVAIFAIAMMSITASHRRNAN